MPPSAVLKKVRYPTIGRPAEPRPELPEALFAARLERVRERMAARGIEALAVYGDREHFATIRWLTNYDPRFEETLLIVRPTGTPILFVGNEGMGYSQIARLPVERRLCQTLSLLGQLRDKVRPLHKLLREAGLNRPRRVGAAGWKYFTADEVAGGEKVLDLPEYLAASLRRALKPGARLTNETALFMDPETGLRNVNEPEQIADFEWIATHNSQNVLDGIRAVRPGRTEFEVFSAMPWNGAMLACHPQCATGENVLRYCMPSPTSRKMAMGDPIFLSFEYAGANTCRFGWIAAKPQDLSAPVRDYLPRVAAPYFDGLAAWYETLKVGAAGRDLHHAVLDRAAPHGLKFGLNIGHLIADDEWTHSPVARGSAQRVRSGAYWQADFFAVTGTAHHGAHVEDGVFVADETLRADLQRRYPALWDRCEKRRKFMIEQLGIRIAADLLPASNFPAALTPFFLSPDQCMARK